MTTIVLADDQPEVRAALRLLIESVDGLAVVGEVGRGDALLAHILHTRPDILLVDWELPKASMPDLARQIRSVDPRIRIIALSVQPESLLAALAVGVDAFTSKGDPAEYLLAAIRRCTAER